MRDKDTIINRMVDDAAEIMEAKVQYNELVVQQIKTKPNRTEYDETTLAILLDEIIRTNAAVTLMRENAGCWA